MLRIALPNKGRLAEGARTLLERAGLDLRFRGERALQATLGEGRTALFVRSADIPEFVANGAADLGITGRDLVEEAGCPVETLLELGYGACRVALAVRNDLPARDVADLPDGVRVATSFVNLTRRYFAAHGRSFELVPISGAAEITPLLGVADAIVDVVDTGSTLRSNGLRELGTLLDTSAVLIASPAALADAERARAVSGFATTLESVLRARGKRYLMANVPRAALADIRRILPGINGPTVVNVLDETEIVAAHAVVDRRDVDRVIAELKAVGAEGILVTGIERLMP
ncbi:MAG: ATP phosphoribosyltransferase [Deinococcales bacterium]|nr:ATP phosphoribosyltransferase [Deinococcales bacterium]